ncbi:hypothetical protein CAPTEDRAFT_196092 [Capitella teleta]|uniref:Aminopeptidase n=1 Tax=Capitella teleta TaxID=283909 RepID=R7U201_CAPTE|nr:hypothetical protein CAPTEDRAFT_196092 [Capitella teleta]|eukprot:ELT97205.1 hypothetical protein CAPTEDRAFT_196092 [Capitella teleta]
MIPFWIFHLLGILVNVKSWTLEESLDRLPGSLRPLEYNITLQPFMYNSDAYSTRSIGSMNGHVKIKFLCVEDTTRIVLHSVDLHILKVFLTGLGSNIEIQEVLFDEKRDFLCIIVDSGLVHGHTYSVDIEYSGKLKRSPIGMFVHHYPQGNSTADLLWTQFSPNGARRAFPCFDEPEYKALFDVVIIRQHHMTSLSNAHLLYTENVTERVSVKNDRSTWMADHFARTPKMSTYLVCFVICEYSHIEATTSSGTLVRVWTRPEVIHLAGPSLSLAVSIQEWFEEYTGLTDPMHKMDHFARDNDDPRYPFGVAMENWGLITYDETYLVSHEEWSDSQHKMTSAFIMTHELGHQWFGNLVTSHWWNDNWLKESFASCRFANFPFIVSENGPLILRMVQQVLSPETFQRGLQLSVNPKQQAAIEDISDSDGSPLIMKQKFDPWLYQSGYPIIHVSWDPIIKTINLTQSHFNPDLFQGYPASEFNYKWNIPITIGDRSNSALLHSGVDIWMDRQDITIKDENLAGDWILINIGAHTLCRVNYDQETFGQIAEQLKVDHQVIHPESRAQFIDDALSLARYGVISAVNALKAVQYLGEERKGLPWKLANDGLQKWIPWIQRHTNTWPLFQENIRQLVDPVYDAIGWDTPRDNYFGSLLHKLIIRLACQLGNEDCLRTANLQFQRWKIYPDSVAVDQRFAVFCYGIRHGTQEDWDFAYERFQLLSTSDSPRAKSEMESLQKALACSSNTETLLRIVESVIDWTFNIRYTGLLKDMPQELLKYSLKYLLTSQDGRWVVWDLLKTTKGNTSSYPYLEDVFSNDMFVKGFASNEDYAEVFVGEERGADEDIICIVKMVALQLNLIIRVHYKSSQTKIRPFPQSCGMPEMGGHSTFNYASTFNYTPTSTFNYASTFNYTPTSTFNYASTFNYTPTSTFNYASTFNYTPTSTFNYASTFN